MLNVKPIPAIVILALISFVLLAAFAVCQDKESENKVSEPNDSIKITLPDPNDISLTCTWNEVYLEVTLTEEPNFAETDRIYLYKGDEFDIVIEKKEPNEPNGYTIECLVFPDPDTVKEYKLTPPEPNEPECEGHGVTAIYCPECHDKVEIYFKED